MTLSMWPEHFVISPKPLIVLMKLIKIYGMLDDSVFYQFLNEGI